MTSLDDDCVIAPPQCQSPPPLAPLTQNVSAPKQQLIQCDFCTPEKPLTTRIEFNEHLLEKHIDEVFHCDTCENYVDRNFLISHMLNHVKEQNENSDVQVELEKVVLPPDISVSLPCVDKKSLIPVEKKKKLPKYGENSFQKKTAKDMKMLTGNVKMMKKCHYCPKLFANRSGNCIPLIATN